VNVQGLALPAQLPVEKPVNRLFEPTVAVIVTESPASTTQVVTLVQPAEASVSVAVPLPEPLVAVLIVGVLTKLAVSVSLLEPALNVQGLPLPSQLPVVKPVKRLLEPLVAVIVIESPTSARQLVTLLQPASESLSVIVTEPLPVPLVALLMVTVLAKLAESVSLEPAEKLHGLLVPLQLPPDQPVKRLPEEAVAVMVIESFTSATHVVTLMQPAAESVSVAVPLPPPLVEVLIVSVLVKLAVSVSLLEPAVKLQGLPAPSQLPVVQAAKRLPEPLVAVIVIESPTSARQLVTLVQPASESLSVIAALPLPLPVVAVVIVTVFAKFAVSVSPLEPAENEQGLVDPVHVPPDQPVKRLPDEAVAVILIESPTSATQLVTLVQPAAESLSVALPLPVPAVAVLTVTVLAKLAVSVSLLEPAVKAQGLALPSQLPVVQPLKRLLEPLVAVIVIESPTSATQVVALVQPASESLSLIVAPPDPLPVVAVVIVTVLAKLAVSVWPDVGEKLQTLPEVGQLPPDQLVKRLPEPALSLNVSESPL
jgi:hypothetical protein